MTTGSRIQNHTQVVTTSCGAGTIGMYSEKNWSGTDDPLKRAVNGYEMSYTEWRDALIVRESHVPGYPVIVTDGTYASCFGGVTFDPLEFGANDTINLINRLGSEIRQHEFNAANSIGAEGKDALKQIAGAASSFYRGMRDLKRGDLSGASREFGLKPSKRDGIAKDLSGKVLATQLGWLPLLGDIKAATEALHAITHKPVRKTYRSKVVLRGDVFPAFDTSRTAKCGETRLSKRLSWTLSEEFDAMDSLFISDPNDLVGMLWAGTTLSFIADWFIPIGDYLEARGNVNRMKGEGYISTFHDTRGRTSWVPEFHTLRSGGPYFYRHLTVSRVPLSTPPEVPFPRFKGLNKVPSWRRALTAVTLAAQALL